MEHVIYIPNGQDDYDLELVEEENIGTVMNKITKGAEKLNRVLNAHTPQEIKEALENDRG